MSVRMSVACTKCKGAIPVEEQMVSNAVALGTALLIEHDVCPAAPRLAGEAPPPERYFRVQVLMWEVDRPDPSADPLVEVTFDGVKVEPMLGFGHTAATLAGFGEAVNGPITEWLNSKWTLVQQNAAFADLPA